MTAMLLNPINIRELEIQNRVMMSPMCQYSAHDGLPNEWHYIHYGTRAVGRLGIIMLEATAVEPRGRITPWDLGLWADDYIDRYTELTTFMISQDTVPAIQLAHAGRKASTTQPWKGSLPLSSEIGGWEVIGPSAIPFAPNSPVPHELSLSEIHDIIEKFKTAANRAYQAGFRIVEIHAAHGYLIHEFLSPLSNKRADKYGGSLQNKQRLLLEIATEIRNQWPKKWPVFVRMSATDWVENGWDIEDTVDTAKKLAEIGIDLIDVSSGGNIANLTIPESPGYQAPFSEAIKEEACIMTSAVGVITEPDQANNIVENKKADIVALGRELLRNPYWVYQAAEKLNYDLPWPKQYLRAK